MFLANVVRFMEWLIFTASMLDFKISLCKHCPINENVYRNVRPRYVHIAGEQITYLVYVGLTFEVSESRA